MQALDDEKYLNICEKMDGLNEEDLNNQSRFTTKYISVFDHWLSELECKQQVMCYEQAIITKDDLKVKSYHDKEKQLVDFYITLYKFTQVYGILYAESGRSKYIVFDSIEEYKSHVLLSIREQLFLKIVLPDYCAVMEGGYDLTHILYCLKSEQQKFDELVSFIKSNDMFILS